MPLHPLSSLLAKTLMAMIMHDYTQIHTLIMGRRWAILGLKRKMRRIMMMARRFPHGIITVICMMMKMKMRMGIMRVIMSDLAWSSMCFKPRNLLVENLGHYIICEFSVDDFVISNRCCLLL